jgi:hypothetical protein
LIDELLGRQTDDRNRREVSNEKRCHHHLRHYSPQFGTMLQEQEKSCALSHSRDWGRDGNIPGPASAKHRNRRSGRGSPGNLWRRAKPLQMACVLQCLKLPYWRYG